MPVILDVMEVILYAEDMPTQVRFYRDWLGLALTYPVGLDDYRAEMWVTFATGACTLVLHGGGKRRLGADSPKVVFRVADIQAARAELLRRGVPLGEVRSPAPGVWVCDGADPEGNSFSIESQE